MSSQGVSIKFCRHCGRIIPLQAVECPYCDKLTIRSQQQQQCPYCYEPIHARAIKCKHCGEFLTEHAQAREAERQRVLYIEKAIVATPNAAGRFELVRPDGAPLPLSGSPEALVGAPAPKALPPGNEGTAAGLLARLSAAQSGVPAVRDAGPLRVAPAMPGAAAVPPPTPARPVPELEYECPSCARNVFREDHYCENCGRDLSLPPNVSGARVVSRPYALADYALAVAAAGPVGLLLDPPASWIVPTGGLALALFCLWRISASGGRLQGKGPAIGAVVWALIWIVMMFIAT